jgi:hypothetical protein
VPQGGNGYAFGRSRQHGNKHDGGGEAGDAAAADIEPASGVGQ